MLIFLLVAAGLHAWRRLPFHAAFIALVLSSTGATSRSSVASFLSDTTRAPIDGNR